MNPGGIAKGANPFSTLRRLARPAPDRERCEFCSLPLGSGHRHLLETGNRRIVCACDPCALRFDNVVGRFKLIPRDARFLDDFRMTDAQWESFSLPIQLAFFVNDTRSGKVVALYPSPGGATESLLPVASWDAVIAENPVLGQMQPDVEALLANRLREAREYYLAPVDLCFALAGLIRVHWRGFSGGDRVWEELNAFFKGLRRDAISDGQPAMEASRA